MPTVYLWKRLFYRTSILKRNCSTKLRNSSIEILQRDPCNILATASVMHSMHTNLQRASKSNQFNEILLRQVRSRCEIRLRNLKTTIACLRWHLMRNLDFALLRSEHRAITNGAIAFGANTIPNRNRRKHRRRQQIVDFDARLCP